MLKHKPFFVLLIIFLPFILCGQNTFSLTGGVSHSQIPVYSQKNNTRLLNTQASNKLTFSFAIQQRFNSSFTTAAAISYSNLGINSFNQRLDLAEYFLHSVSVEYLTFSYVPKGEIKFGKLYLAAGIGGAMGLAIRSKSENFMITDNSIDFVDNEDTNLKKMDAALVFNLELRRVIGNDLNLILLLERYQGLINASTINDTKLHISSSAIRIGLQFPIKRKKT